MFNWLTAQFLSSTICCSTALSIYKNQNGQTGNFERTISLSLANFFTNGVTPGFSVYTRFSFDYLSISLSVVLGTGWTSTSIVVILTERSQRSDKQKQRQKRAIRRVIAINPESLRPGCRPRILRCFLLYFVVSAVRETRCSPIPEDTTTVELQKGLIQLSLVLTSSTAISKE